MAASMSTKFIQQYLNTSRRIVSQSAGTSYAYVLHIQNSSTKSQQAPIDYCVDLVKNCDHESYLCTMLYPKHFRGSAFAIRALYTELALVQDVTTDSMRAMLRLQFWKDTIDLIYKNQPPQSPVALQVTKKTELSRFQTMQSFKDPKEEGLMKTLWEKEKMLAVNKHNLSKTWFSRILEARAEQVNKDSYKSIKEVEEMAEQTVSSLNYLLLEAAGIKDVNADHACSHLGKSQGLVTLLRAMPYHASRNRVYIPFELLIKHKVSQEQILRSARKKSEQTLDSSDEKVGDIIYEIACAAKQHLDTAQSLKKNAPKNTEVIMLNSVILDGYLTKLEQTNFDVCNPVLQVKDNRLAWKLLKKRIF